MANTKIDLITGFLGAGKTTFIRAYAANLKSQGLSFAIIENEYGAAGVDSDLLKGDGMNVRELSGGCVCCTQKLNFHNAMVELAGRVDRIIVEPSGIFRADDFIEMLKSPTLAGKAKLNMLLCVVDPALPALGSVARGVLQDELAFATGVFISHCDAADPKDIRAARAEIAAMGIAPARIFAKPLDELSLSDFEAMSGDMIARRYAPADIAHTTAFNSATLAPAREFAAPEITSIFDLLRKGEYGNILRVKGRLHGANADFSVNMTPDSDGICACPQGPASINIIGENLKRREIARLFG